uniref:Uncharacterized protein n=1 Tax=Trepomonas sp. PC1 TaxID=1076344 RepID=A0A146K587_9EUKA|eukprot:JAP91025.1 Hypothetical protein TPC1_17481 [Trepomonas sp. PC1]
MTLNELSTFLKLKTNASDSVEFIQINYATLKKTMMTQPKSDQQIQLYTLSLQCFSYTSQFQPVCQKILNQPDVNEFIRVFIHQGVKMYKSKLQPFLLSTLVNLTVSQNGAQKVASSILKNEIEFLYELFSAQQLSLYFLENISRFVMSKMTPKMLIYPLRQLQRRDQDTEETAVRVIKNLAIHLRDHLNLKSTFTPIIKDLILELTFEDFHKQFLQSLKEFETDTSFLLRKQHSKQTMFDIVEILILYVRVDKVEVKKYYPQLRECHMFLAELNGEDQLNDALNVLIEHCLSDDPSENQIQNEEKKKEQKDEKKEQIEKLDEQILDAMD